MSGCFLLRLGDALGRAFRRRDGAAAPSADAQPTTTGERIQASLRQNGSAPAPIPGPPQRLDAAVEGEAQRPSAEEGRGRAQRRVEPGLLGDPLVVQGQLTILEAQATKLKATIQRRKRLQGDSGPILGHYEGVLAGLEGEIAFLSGSGMTGPDAATGACVP